MDKEENELPEPWVMGILAEVVCNIDTMRDEVMLWPALTEEDGADLAENLKEYGRHYFLVDVIITT